MKRLKIGAFGRIRAAQEQHDRDEVIKGLNKQIEELKKINTAKSDLIAFTSHELKSPLTAVKEALGLLAQEPAEKNADMQRKFLGIAEQGLDRLANIIDGILDIHALESGKRTMKRDRVNLKDIVCGARDLFGPMAAKEGAELSVEIGREIPLVWCDSSMIQEVLSNLVSNAIKASSSGGKIVISVNEIHRYIEVSVSDTGIGIPEEHLGNVFKKFYRVPHPSGSGAKKGSGLGLFIVKEIVELHRGYIYVESKPGQGSRFVFTLPKDLREGQTEV
ncbi:MAG: HAMP domain-containing sensor histidine kinase [Candidatus Omnitrophota bacterium]